MLGAAREHPRARLQIVALDTETVTGVPPKIAFHAAADWLLAR